MEKSIPKDCPYYEPDAKDPTIFWCSVVENYINRFFAACCGVNYESCEHYKEQALKRKEKIV